MALDARLACLEILTMAAKRAKARQTAPPTRTVTLKVVYDDPLEEGPMEGPTYTYYVPETGPAWRASAC